MLCIWRRDALLQVPAIGGNMKPTNSIGIVMPLTYMPLLVLARLVCLFPLIWYLGR